MTGSSSATRNSGRVTSDGDGTPTRIANCLLWNNSLSGLVGAAVASLLADPWAVLLSNSFIEGETVNPGVTPGRLFVAPGSGNAVAFQDTDPGSHIDAGTLQTDGRSVPAAPALDNGWLRADQSRAPHDVIDASDNIQGTVEVPSGRVD